MRMLLVAVFIFGITWAAGSQPAQDALKQLEGVWLPAEAELGGEPFPKEILKTMRLVVKNDSSIVHVGGVKDEGALKVDTTQKPAALDIVGTNGPNKGKTILAIYERTGDTLRVCYDLAGKKRPVAFKTARGTQQYYVVYRRMPSP